MPERGQDYQEMTVDELQDVAREKGISGFSSMRKDELIEAIERGGGDRNERRGGERDSDREQRRAS